MSNTSSFITLMSVSFDSFFNISKFLLKIKTRKILTPLVDICATPFGVVSVSITSHYELYLLVFTALHQSVHLAIVLRMTGISMSELLALFRLVTLVGLLLLPGPCCKIFRAVYILISGYRPILP